MKKYQFAITVATVYLLIYVWLIQIDFNHAFIFLLFSLSPVVLIYMVYQILKNGKYNGPSLAPDESFGYQDVDKNKLGAF